MYQEQDLVVAANHFGFQHSILSGMTQKQLQQARSKPS
jgi:hypothetical protein